MYIHTPLIIHCSVWYESSRPGLGDRDEIWEKIIGVDHEFMTKEKLYELLVDAKLMHVVLYYAKLMQAVL